MQTQRANTRRSLLRLAIAVPWLGACRARQDREVQEEPTGRFKGIRGAEMVVDAVEGAEMEGVEFFDDRGTWVFASSVISKDVQKSMGYSSPYIPESIHVIWRRNPTPQWGPMGRITYEGPISGDYIVPVAPRLPDAVLDDIRAHGGGLRLKFRLKPDGVLFGWDVGRMVPIPGCDPRQNLTCKGSVILFPGGDFLETRY